MSVDLARQQWEDGARRLQEASRDPLEHDRLITVVDALVADLRRRIGGQYTLAELADEYGRADRWTREVVGGAAPVPGWTRQLATAGDGRVLPLRARRRRLHPVIREPAKPRHRVRRVLRGGLLAVVLVAVFAAGIALGMAIQDSPQPGPPVTVERTVELPAAPGR